MEARKRVRFRAPFTQYVRRVPARLTEGQSATSWFSEKPYKRKQFSHMIFFLDSRLTPGNFRNSLTPLGNGPSAWG